MSSPVPSVFQSVTEPTVLHDGALPGLLIVKYPYGEVAPGRSDRFMQPTDVLPMLAKRLSLSMPPDTVAPLPEQLDAFAEIYPSQVSASDHDWRMLLSGNYKLLSSSDGKRMLFNLADDPEELNDLASSQPDRLSAMSSVLERFLAQLPEARMDGARAEVDEETRRALESLGYLE